MVENVSINTNDGEIVVQGEKFKRAFDDIGVFGVYLDGFIDSCNMRTKSEPKETSWQQRLIIERDELSERFDKLRAYIRENTASMKNGDSDGLSLLIRQREAMREYLDILNERIKNL